MQAVIVLVFVVIPALCQLVARQDDIDTVLEDVFVPLTTQKDGSQTYGFRFRTSNGIERRENGYENPDPNVGLVVTGSYSYVRPDGRIEQVSYIADKNGFRIIRGHIGVGIPAAALASIAG